MSTNVGYLFYLSLLDHLTPLKNKSQMSHDESSSSSSSSPGSSDEDIPIANLKRPTRRQVLDANESSDEEEDIPLCELAKQARQSGFSAHSSWDEEEEEEEGGDISEIEEPWGEVVDEDILPPSLKLVWDGGKIVKETDPETGAKIWRCGHCNHK